jgi:predicted Zn finger-like uncharacterized protein
MALATQCPHCQTTFRVAQDQLKLRAGLVRCGHCKEIFNGIEHLLPPSATGSTPPSSSASTPSKPPAAVPAEAPAQESVTTSVFESHASVAIPNAEPEETETASAIAEKPVHRVTHIDFDIPAPEPDDREIVQATEATASETESIPREDPLQRMTLMDFTRELPDSIEPPRDELTDSELSISDENTPKPVVAERDELDEAIEDLQRKPWRGKKKAAKKLKAEEEELDPLDEADSDEEEEPGFLKRGRRHQRLSRKLRLFFGIGSAVLLIVALAQGTYVFRNQLAGFFPQTKPMLAQMCSIVGCHIDLPAQIASVSIESSELQTLASSKDRFVLTTLLRNYSSTAQEWPYIELTLNDGNEKALLRRVFKPADYVTSPNDMRLGLGADSERTVKLTFELSQVQASGYRVYLFYP